jgi:type IV secretory pathway VirB2 component (pilin)
LPAARFIADSLSPLLTIVEFILLFFRAMDECTAWLSLPAAILALLSIFFGALMTSPWIADSADTPKGVPRKWQRILQNIAALMTGPVVEQCIIIGITRLIAATSLTGRFQQLRRKEKNY